MAASIRSWKSLSGHFSQSLRINNKIVRNCSTSSVQQNSTNCNDIQIKIPDRIERGPTDILKALSSTIGKDYTAPHYKYRDDPYLIPASNFAKRTYALAQESGKKTAIYFVEKYPELFMNNPAEPSIEAFMPKIAGITIDSLVMNILNAEVTEAVKVYQSLKKEGTQIPDDILQSFLELLCFYNCENPPDEDFTEERWFHQNMPTARRKTWKDQDLAENIFSNMQNKTTEAYGAMIKGLAKFYAIDKAIKLFEEAKSKNLILDVESHNAMIGLIIYMKEGSENRWEFLMEFMEEMNKTGIHPNLNTMVATLELVSKFGSYPKAKNYALSVMAEMKRLNIEPSLACYYYLLVTFCKERGPVSSILYDIMDYLDEKEFTIRHPKDTSFFVMAMDVCFSHIQDKDMAYRVDKLLNTANNYVLIGDSFKESVYYQNFFKILCSSESIEKLFEVYYKLVPNTYTPEPAVIQDIIQAIDLSGELHYIPQIWSDIVVFNVINREQIIRDVLNVLVQNEQEEMLQKQFSKIAKDLFTRLSNEDQSRDRIRSSFGWTGAMLSNLVIIHLNSGRFDYAWEVMKKCEKDQSKISGFLNQHALHRLIEECVKLLDIDKAMVCLQYASDVGLDEADDMVSIIQDRMDITENQKLKIEELVGLKS